VIAIVGLGRWGQNHLRTVSKIVGPEKMIGVDPRPGMRARATELGVASVSSIDDLPDSVHAAVIATPTPTHVEIATRLLQRDLHLLVEKPVALRPDEAQFLVEDSKQRGVVLMVGHVMLFQRAHERMWELLRPLGPLRMLVLERRTPGCVMPASGAWHELAPHELAVAVDLGALSTPAVVDTYQPWSVTGVGTEDGAFTRLHTAECTVEIRCSWLSGFRSRQVWAIAEKGQAMLTDDGIVQRVAVVPDTTLWTDVRPHPPEWETVAGRPPLERQFLAFLDAIDGGDGGRRSDGSMAMQVTELLHQVALWKS
jgi:predicted dehydrogenase